MANFKYFFDKDGLTEELQDVQLVRRETRTALIAAFPGMKIRRLGMEIWVGKTSDGFEVPVTRQIEYKSRPSLHKCDSRCMNGRCNGVCECRCGGKNHGINRA